ncbi:MAG: group 1 glycosyl transferase [Parcubacteria group bacterium Licking1014_17]|nr:MAG: group 1 glycosyl transferase [Parcubacteria group bacterium Licking1014_17]
MIRIGIECESIEDNSWGIGRVLTNLLQELSARSGELSKEFEFVLFFKSHVPNYSYLSSSLFKKTLLRLPLQPFSSFSLYYYIFLPLYLLFKPVDVIFLPNYMLPFGINTKTLVILTEDVYKEIHSSAQKTRYRLAYSIFANHAARGATKIMTISISSAINVSRVFNIKLGRIVINQLGVRKPMKIEEGKKIYRGKYILSVSQAFPRRHLKESIDAFESIAGDFPGLKFIIIGADKYDPPIIEDIKNIVNQRLGYEAIIHKEYVTDEELALLYSGASAVIYISFHEAFGLPPLEGLTYGAVPVVADTDITREIFGPEGFYVETPHRSDVIAQIIREALLNSEKKEMIKSMIPKILEKYSWGAHTDRFIDIIRSIAKS